MRLPADLGSSAIELRAASVRTSRNPLRMPPYAVKDLQRTIGGSSTTGIGPSLRQSGTGAEAGSFFFVLTEGGVERWDVACSTAKRPEDPAEPTNFPEQGAFYCELMRSDDEKPWSLQLDGRAAGPAGVLTNGVDRYSVQTSFAVEGSPLPIPSPSGYRIHAAERTLAVVDLMGSGRLLVAPGIDAETTRLFAAVAAALLLHNDFSPRL